MSWLKSLRPGEKWSGIIRKGKKITIKVNGTNANLGMMVFCADRKDERYNMADTLKAQHTSMFTKGHLLMSDNGRAMVSIIEDSLGWHDPISSYTTRESTSEQYGVTSFQTELNQYKRNGEDNFLMELVRQGYERKDLGPVVNLFSKLSYDESGAITFEQNHGKSGDYIVLRTEVDSVFFFSNTPHPLSRSQHYPSAEIEWTITDAAEIENDDLCLNQCEENRRAFENTWQDEQLAGKSNQHVYVNQ
ncbi:urea amidolyase associated protein UAAP1 [Shouchella sp. 1P09AA]|uniref:urea amidolyase associated protein UAAP1 n=1 Tax=unclassified Shouchella TaxID=2893065 RepID=UPI0039A19E2B